MCNLRRVFAAAAVTLSLLPSMPALAQAQAQAQVFWVPIEHGTIWRFAETGSVVDSTGASSSYGPVPLAVSFEAVDLQIGDHHATTVSSNGWYLDTTPNGYFRVYEDDPQDSGWYRYYDEPEPFMTMDALDVGSSVTFSGQWGVPGGGYERWRGIWGATFTNLGADTVSTPLGTFQATRLQVASSDELTSRELYPHIGSRGNWNEVRWFVDGFGFVKIQGSGLSESDFDGDGVFERWQWEELTYVASPVPEPLPSALLVQGLLPLAGVVRARRRRAVGGTTAAAPRP